jgi:hypothetical protein
MADPARHRPRAGWAGAAHPRRDGVAAYPTTERERRLRDGLASGHAPRRTQPPRAPRGAAQLLRRPGGAPRQRVRLRRALQRQLRARRHRQCGQRPGGAAHPHHPTGGAQHPPCGCCPRRAHRAHRRGAGARLAAPAWLGTTPPGRTWWVALPGFVWLLLSVALLAAMPALLLVILGRSFTFWQLCLAMPRRDDLPRGGGGHRRPARGRSSHRAAQIRLTWGRRLNAATAGSRPSRRRPVCPPRTPAAGCRQTPSNSRSEKCFGVPPL